MSRIALHPRHQHVLVLCAAEKGSMRVTKEVLDAMIQAAHECGQNGLLERKRDGWALTTTGRSAVRLIMSCGGPQLGSVVVAV